MSIIDEGCARRLKVKINRSFKLKTASAPILKRCHYHKAYDDLPESLSYDMPFSIYLCCHYRSICQLTLSFFSNAVFVILMPFCHFL